MHNALIEERTHWLGDSLLHLEVTASYVHNKSMHENAVNCTCYTGQKVGSFEGYHCTMQVSSYISNTTLEYLGNVK